MSATMERRRAGTAILAAAAALVLVRTCLSDPPSPAAWDLPPADPNQGLRALSETIRVRGHKRNPYRTHVVDLAPPPPAPWSEEEHAQFIQGLGDHGFGHKNYHKIFRDIKTRSFAEVRKYAASYFSKLAQGEEAPAEIFGWPSDRDTEIPAGTYFRAGGLGLKETREPFGVGLPDHGRVLLYMTTHFSYQHILYLRYCWKNVLAQSPLLQGADIAVLLNPNDDKRRKAAMDLLEDVFEGHNLMVYIRNYHESGYLKGGTRGVPLLKVKQSGAVMAMYEGVQHGYFEGYDWVVRVNPDVLIRDDTYFRQAMANPNLSALLVNCHSRMNLHLHTDFFVVRPEVLKAEEFPREILSTGAEMSFTTSLRNTVLNVRPYIYEWIPGAAPAPKAGCRVAAGKDFHESPVVHEHYLHPEICSVPEEDREIVDNVFPTGWPKSWTPVD